MSAVPVSDATLNKFVIKVTNNYKDKIKIKDERVDLSTRFSRTLTFSNGRKKVVFELPDGNIDRIKVTGTELKKTTYITAKNNKVASFKITNNFKKIKDLL
ncbi:hypothetical protein KY334_05480 [Candidatus Woesearchaeota archaeon]|nr:hypothetical protein [Candidatus Woesearchaeota archaeon]